MDTINILSDESKHGPRYDDEGYCYKNIKNMVLEKINRELEISVLDPYPKTGTYGDIYFGKKKSSNNHEIFVIKIFKDDFTNHDVMNEISCLSVLRNYPNFPKLYYIVEIENGDGAALIMSYCGEIINATNIIKYNRQFLALQLVKLYKKLDDLQILHRDIKNNNICIDENGILSIIDFGYARRAPYFTTQMEVITANRHVESLANFYNVAYSRTIDALSIFNTLFYIFNVTSSTYEYHPYPLTIESSEEQIYNISYLLLCENNTEKIRAKIYGMLKKIINYIPKNKIINSDNIKEKQKFKMDMDEYHRIFAPSAINQKIYEKYAALKKNVPKNFYNAMKKLLNINPNKRIPFNKFYLILEKNYPELLNIQDNQKLLVEPTVSFGKINFNRPEYFLCNSPDCKYLLAYFDNIYPSTIYALSYYRFFNIKNSFAEDEHKMLLKHIIFFYYNSMYESIYPTFMKFHLDMKIYMKYLSESKYDLHPINPYNFIDYMQLFKWNIDRKLLFDYFMAIASTHNIFCSMDPFLLCLVITILIYRIGCKIPIEINTFEETIHLPERDIQHFILNRTTFNSILENKNFVCIVNKFYGYYAKLCLDSKLVIINKYFINDSKKLESYINFYRSQILRDCVKKS